MSEAGELERARVVLFATHALLAGEMKGLNEPALVLASPPADAVRQEDDGLLRASETTQLRLGADWVVLSACNTARDSSLGADALSCLARAFIYAGARALLVLHWEVESDAAVQLVTRGVAELQAAPGIGRAKEMRRATAGLLAEGRIGSHPTTWAPFVVVGDGTARASAQ